MAAIMLMTTALFIIAGCNKENNDSDVKVTTYTPQEITQTTAKCGGDVIVTQGLSLNELGVCWSTERNPTASDSHLSTTNWSETYVCTIISLEPNTSYHVRAYALRGLEYYYGEDKSFCTASGNGIYNGHEYVDLGLPSGTLWATCNVGADTPEGYGDYFAWGETEPKSTYNLSTYLYCNGNYNMLTKYCDDASFGYNGFTDTLTVLLPEDDAATANWGEDWRIPTKEEWEELYNNTTCTWTTQNGVDGKLFTASNGNALFLPVAGLRYEDSLYYNGSDGWYWSGSLVLGYPSRAWTFDFFSDGYTMYFYDRSCGQSVRAVRSVPKN